MPCSYQNPVGLALYCKMDLLLNRAIIVCFRAAQRSYEQKRKEEEKKKYEDTLKDAAKDEEAFRKRSDSERRRRLQVWKYFIINWKAEATIVFPGKIPLLLGVGLDA